MKIDSKHYLDGESVLEKKLTPNLYKPPEFKFPDLPDSIVIHYTAMNSLESAVEVLTKDNNKASAHLVVGRNGDIKQLAPFNYRTWHAGISSFNGRSGYNHYSIGIEIDNLGWLDKYNGFYSRPELIDYNIKILETDVVQMDHKNPMVRKKYWHKYTQEQIHTVIDICKLLVSTYSIKEIVGHDDIAPDRKQDPGPAFPMDYIVKEVFHANRQDNGEPQLQDTFASFVSTEKLNIRSGPNSEAERISKPLKKGSKVTILDQSGDWYKVKTEIEGWVYSKYIG
jgi:N-acetylmuramoyl-L-alanine amidase